MAEPEMSVVEAVGELREKWDELVRRKMQATRRPARGRKPAQAQELKRAAKALGVAAERVGRWVTRYRLDRRPLAELAAIAGKCSAGVGDDILLSHVELLPEAWGACRLPLLELGELAEESQGMSPDIRLEVLHSFMESLHRLLAELAWIRQGEQRDAGGTAFARVALAQLRVKGPLRKATLGAPRAAGQGSKKRRERELLDLVRAGVLQRCSASPLKPKGSWATIIAPATSTR